MPLSKLRFSALCNARFVGIQGRQFDTIFYSPPVGERALGLLKRIMKKTPLLRDLRDIYVDRKLASMDAEHVFTEIFRKNKWRGHGSVSGRGSDFDHTGVVIVVLPGLFREYGISRVLDIPCGDFHWMQNVDLSGIDYTGADIVRDLIVENNRRFQRNDVRFLHLNLIDDALPRSDLVFCRDCLVHLSFSDILKALNNICDSGARYLLTTTFVDRAHNSDIKTGRWRELNLELPPFGFPKPVALINEQCREGDGLYRDKSLGLWLVDDIRVLLHSSNRT